MKITKILLAVAVLALALLLFFTRKSNTEIDKESIVLENIASRTSIRAYTEAPVEQSKIEKMLKAAMAAPTAMNKQPWHFVVVTDKDQLKALYGKAADDMPLLYGGSVNPSNAGAYLMIPGINGLLIGGASLIADHFIDIIDIRGVNRTKETGYG